jgi:hypothetical protein
VVPFRSPLSDSSSTIDRSVKYVQADEIWGFVFKKEKHKTVAETNKHFIGDAFTLPALMLLWPEAPAHSSIKPAVFHRRLWESHLSYWDTQLEQLPVSEIGR